MKRTNKILSILLATILILSTFSISVVNAADETITFSAQTDVISAKAGDVVNVDISMSENSTLAALTLAVNYDNTALKILSAETQKKFGYEEFNTVYANNQLLYLVASTDAKSVSGTLFTIQFKVLKEGCTEISLSVNELTDIDLKALPSATQSAKIHNFDNGTVTQPTCTDKGFTTYNCTCGFSYQANETAATGHDYDYENGVLTRPTETSKGYYTYTCKNDANHTTTVTVESADYTEYDNALQKLEGYLLNSNLTAESKELIFSEVVKIIQNNSVFLNFVLKEHRDLIASEQYIVDNLTNEINEFFQVVDSIIANCEAGNHIVRAYTPDNNASCIVNGTKRGACYVCGTRVVVDDENNPALGHDIVVDNAVSPDCVNTGLAEGSHCSRCDDATVEQKIVPALGHSYNSVVTAPTCTEGGYTTYTCSACGDVYVGDETQATGHNYNKEITTPATHTENGLMTYTCACGDTYTESIDATGDHYHVPSVTAPTCTEGGYTTYTCVCGDTYVSDETLATGHDYDYENVVLIRPTETRKGCYMYICANDTEHIMYEEVESADYTEYDKAVAKLGEYLSNSNLTPEAKEFIVAECVEIIRNNSEFYESGIKERRDLIASEQHIIDKVTNELNEHFEVVDNFIANCEAGNHDVRDYVSDDNATCTVNGTKRGACYYCGAEVVVDDENNPASGHDIVVDNAVAPDCVNTGLTEGSHCSRCDGATTEQEVVPALGHSYNSVVTAPTCTEGGYTTYTCACGDSYVDDETSAIGHSFSNGSCTVCGDADPDYYVFSVKSPSKTKIRNKDGIILHTEITGNAPEGSYVKWSSDNGNFDKTVLNDGMSMQVLAKNKGDTVFTAILCDANGNELVSDSVTIYSDSGFFQKIFGFFRSLFGATTIYKN